MMPKLLWEDGWPLGFVMTSSVSSSSPTICEEELFQLPVSRPFYSSHDLEERRGEVIKEKTDMDKYVSQAGPYKSHQQCHSVRVFSLATSQGLHILV